ncbi:KTSC domain-containing protein [Nannocystis pusilla]|uniref:KTSC domain-containing protein n=1 Tax=Nannocystis pusilla TaxID=889268 RepID=UPI003BF2CE83
MPYFSSSAIDYAEYDDATSTLRIWFTSSDGPYDYYGVPRHHYEGLCAATSKGRYFNDHIRDRYGGR